MNLLVTSLIFGVAIAIGAWMVLSVIFAPRTNRGQNHRFEVERRTKLRDESFVFRHFEPAIDEIAAQMETGKNSKLVEFGEFLSTSGISLSWKPAEFLATKVIESILCGMGAIGFLMMLGYSPVTSLLLSSLVGGGYYWLAKNGVKKKAEKRRGVIKRNFAAAIDLLALMMEVGGSFHESLKVVTRENAGKALGEELGLIVHDIDMGKPRKHALENFSARINDDDISEVVFACNESEELGVPIAQTLKTQADRIRDKRSAWAEKAAQEAEVNLVFPTMLIMLACLITVGAPFVLQGLRTFLGGSES